MRTVWKCLQVDARESNDGKSLDDWKMWSKTSLARSVICIVVFVVITNGVFDWVCV